MKNWTDFGFGLRAGWTIDAIVQDSQIKEGPHLKKIYIYINIYVYIYICVCNIYLYILIIKKISHFISQ